MSRLKAKPSGSRNCVRQRLQAREARGPGSGSGGTSGLSEPRLQRIRASCVRQRERTVRAVWQRLGDAVPAAGARPS